MTEKFEESSIGTIWLIPRFTRIGFCARIWNRTESPISNPSPIRFFNVQICVAMSLLESGTSQIRHVHAQFAMDTTQSETSFSQSILTFNGTSLMVHQVKFMMIGGFLGAGKTTTLSRLAKHYIAQGLSVGVVTNDQAANLVDTNHLRSQGFDVGEVAGACFCCHFDHLMERLQEFHQTNPPDLILAEPVGSCTDLVATVIQPIKQLYDARFEIAPYCVILKPSHGRRILKNEAKAGFSPKAAYILKKQLEEADAILINRIDELEEVQIEELQELIHQHYPHRPLLRISAKTGAGFDQFIEFLSQEGDFGKHVLDIDYDIYAEGEAELGWLNTSVTLRSTKSFALDDLLLDLVTQLQSRFEQDEIETAHLKTIGLWEGFFGVANLISSENEAELSLASHCEVQSVDVIVNARVACDPVLLEQHVSQVIQECCETRSATHTAFQTQTFRPGRPVPTHRMTASD